MLWRASLPRVCSWPLGFAIGRVVSCFTRTRSSTSTSQTVMRLVCFKPCESTGTKSASCAAWPWWSAVLLRRLADSLHFARRFSWSARVRRGARRPVGRRRRLSRGDVSPTPASPGATAGTPELHPAVGDARVPGSARTSRAPTSLVVGPHAQDVDHVLIRKDLVDEAVLNVDAP